MERPPEKTAFGISPYNVQHRRWSAQLFCLGARRRTLGTAVFAGMLGVTLFGIIMTPVFYCVVRGLIPHSGTTASRER
jgi:hypothetical protein